MTGKEQINKDVDKFKSKVRGKMRSKALGAFNLKSIKAKGKYRRSARELGETASDEERGN